MRYGRCMGNTWSRRDFFALGGASVAALLLGCGDDDSLARSSPTPSDPAFPGLALPDERPAPPRPAPRPEGHEVRTWLPGTPWETHVSIRSSGLPGPVMFVLGGVHGNEPAAYLAADEIEHWEPETGVLAVAPRVNVRAIEDYERAIEGEGDLNRQYPGDPADDLPTSRLAAEITALAGELNADLLIDLHESWAYYQDLAFLDESDRDQLYTAFLGQTLTGGPGPLQSQIASSLAAEVNAAIAGGREQFVVRDSWLGESDQDDFSRSSLALGQHVPGLTAVLVETAQEGVSLDRRVQLHLMVVRAAIDLTTDSARFR